MVSLALGVCLEGLAQGAATPPDSKQLKMVKWTPDFQITNDDVTIVLEKIAERSPIISTMRRWDSSWIKANCGTQLPT